MAKQSTARATTLPAKPVSGKPIPLPDEVSAPYWQAAAQHTLKVQYCDRCRRYVHPPEPYCPRCQHAGLRFEQVSGEGSVYSYTIVRDNATRGFEDVGPYVVALVELKEQPRLTLVANIVGVAIGEVRVGMPVQVTWEEIGEGFVLPQFTPA
jgi:uncharacterized OB-fold protein